ncbi:MAG TPA: hypothetical protein VJ063_21615, partial [Verrucomicrobiae bacterium]|nr:hypothetical protein [Verrucomicrobiae bacterium]
MPETLPPAVPPPELRLDSEHPWPGLISFTEADHAFFFGREREVAELARAIRQKTVTVFFGKSGLGKSSILRAGVAPLLRESEFVSIYIRLNHDEAAPPLQDQVEIAIERVVTAEKIEAPKLVRSETLWEHFHKKECDWWDSDNRLVKPVLVFDQFEELLTLGQSTPERAVRTAAFLSELEDLVENRPPTALAQRFEAERGLARNYDLERLDYRVVLTLREDFLPDLEGLREQLRAIMFNRVRLLPMSGEQAMEVILKPGGHLVDEDVAVRIVDFVSSSERSRLQSAVTRAQIAKRAIEPALLSVILQELNNRRIQAGQNKITTDLVGNAQAAEIFQDFYRRGLQGLGEPVREFIEDWLLTSSGARNRIAEEDALTKPGISEPVLATLIDRRIVQRETTGRIKWLELTHDTLADVVRADRAEHQQHRQLELAAAREAETRKKLRRVQKLAMAFAVLLVVALLLFLYASNQKRAAQKAQNFTIRTTDRLANGMLQKIQQTSRIRIAEKQDLAGQLINIVQQLRGEAPEELSIRLADLLATTSLMFFDAGRDDEAATYAKQAESLVASAQARSGNDSVALARVQLASALTLRRNWQLEKALGKFEQAQARLKDAFSHGLEEPLSGSVLQARLSSAYSLALNADNRAEEAEKIIAGSISEIEKTLARPANKDPSIRYDLTRELLRLKTARFDNARFAGNVEAMNASYAAAEEALRKAKADFPSTVDRFWNYFDAKNRDMEAYIAQRQDLYDQALAKMGAAIAELHQLLSDDPQNMFWRFELGNALCHRAEIAKAVAGSVVGLDKDAAEKLADTDREAARKLAITLRRDQHSRWLCFWLARLVDYEDDAPSAAASYLTRIDLEERKSGSRVELREEKVFAHAACLKAYLKRKDFRLAIREAEAALAEVDLLDTNNRKEPARRQAMRVEILEELLRVPAEDLGRSAWSGAYDTVITDLKEWAASGLNPADQASSERYVNSELADQYLRDTKFSDAIGIYQKLAADTLNTINAGQNQRLELQNYLYYRRKIVECQTALAQWSAVPGVCRDTREHLVALVEKQPALTSVLPYVQSLVSSMEAAHKSLKEKVSSLDAETASVFKTLSSELEAMQE